MHDIKFIRDNPQQFDQILARRGIAPLSAQILEIDQKRRKLIHAAETAKAEQNVASKEVGLARARGDEAEFERLRTLIAQKKTQLSALGEEATQADTALDDFLMGIPNLPFDDVPDGQDENDNIEIRKWGAPRAIPDAREHFDIPAVRTLFDMEHAARLSGSRFMILRGALARLHRALGQFMIDLHVDTHALDETITPVIVRAEALRGTGQLPKFGADLYRVETGHYLIPTAEVTLTNLVSGEIVEAADLPMRLVAKTQCFRSEAGSAGRDTTGILRQHQFEKVEMVTICHPDQSTQELERMTQCAEAVLQALELPYRVVALCAGDMGFSAHKTYDLEVWLPGQDTYREISSCSNCGDFQARRMQARLRQAEGSTSFLHTLNGSGLAVGRTLIAVLENGQQADGSVLLPRVLAPYLGGAQKILPDGSLK